MIFTGTNGSNEMGNLSPSYNYTIENQKTDRATLCRQDPPLLLSSQDTCNFHHKVGKVLHSYTHIRPSQGGNPGPAAHCTPTNPTLNLNLNWIRKAKRFHLCLHLQSRTIQVLLVTFAECLLWIIPDLKHQLV